MKIMLFGRPGSGKSTFANQLGQKLNIPVYHLDKYFYEAHWKERPYQDFLRIQQELVNLDHWIIDGNATKSLETRWAKADVVIYFLFPRLICLWRVIKRKFTKKDPKIDDRPPNCPEIISWKFFVYIWTFNQRVEAQITKLRAQCPAAKFYQICSNQALNQLKDL